jgi:uncharacterized OsmC-like protein
VAARSRNCALTIDEPHGPEGAATGMNPAEALLCSLGACQSIAARAYAPQFQVKLDDFRVEIEGDIDPDGLFDQADGRPGYAEVRYTFRIKTDSPIERVEQFVKFLESRCPIGDTIAGPVRMKLQGIVIEE